MNIRTYAHSAITSALAAGVLAFSTSATAQQTLTGTLTVRLAIDGSCSVVSDGFLDFPAQHNAGTISADGEGSFQVTCTNNTPFQVGMDNGSYFDSGTRRMANGTDYITYQLFKDGARNEAWGDQGSDMLIGRLGTGNPVPISVYGRVPSQSFSGPNGLYQDTVAITVSY